MRTLLALVLCSACFGWGVRCGAWGTAQAQTANAATSAAAASAASAPEAKLSERVLREASNPMRIILDAGKVIKRRPGDGATTVRASTTPAAASAATPKPAAAAALSPPNLPTTVLRAAQDANASLQSTASNAVAAAPLASLAVREPLALPTGDATALTAATAALTPAPTTAAAQPTAAAPPSPLKLITMVSPDIPERVAHRVGALTEVMVQLTIQRDGTVRDISVVQPGQKAVEPYIIEALGQWRYAPISEPRTQRVQLVFNN